MQSQNIPSMKSARMPCIIATIVFIVYAALLSCKSVAGFPVSHFTHNHWPWLGDKPLGEDGFYMLTVSDNLVTMHKLVYDYGRPATGIQPLIVIVFSGISWCIHALHLDRWIYIRVLLFFNSALFVFFCWQVAYIAKLVSPPSRRSLVFLLAFFLAICDFTLFRLFTYGLETGLYLCCIAVAYRCSIKIATANKASWGNAITLGVTGGVAGLARIDFGIIFAIVLAFLLIRRSMSLIRMLVCGLVALLIVSPWLIFVHAVSGSWIPSSGHAESRLITFESLGRIATMSYAVLSHIAPWTFNANTVGAVSFILVSLALVVFLIYKAQEMRGWFIASNGYLSLIAPWLTAFLLLDCIYVVFFWSGHFYTRYSSPLIILTVPALALVLAEQKIIARRPIFAIVPLISVFLVFDVLSLHSGHMGSSQFISAGYVHQYYPNSHVGSFQSGTEGYFNRNVDNLDGKLNTEALRAAQAQHLPAYIDAIHINVLIDWPGYIHSLPESYLYHEWISCPYPMPTADNICLIRKATP